MMNRRELLGAAGVLSLVPVLPASGVAMAAPVLPDLEATLLLGPASSGVGNHRWAPVLQGIVTGSMPGVVRSGRLDWHVDPASGAVAAQLQCQIECTDGKVRELRERSLRAAYAGPGKVRLVALAPA